MPDSEDWPWTARLGGCVEYRIDGPEQIPGKLKSNEYLNTQYSILYQLGSRDMHRYDGYV